MATKRVKYMEYLTIIYNEESHNIYTAYVVQYPNIVAYKSGDLELTQHVIYELITEEMFYKYKNLTSWCVSTEIINYLIKNEVIK